MEGQSSEGIQKKKARTRNACDVGCQTDQSTSTPGSLFPSSLLGASHSSTSGSQQNGQMGQWDKPGKENGGISSSSTSGASTPGTGTAASSSPAPSVATQASTDSKKLAGPAGVKPNEIEAYFGEKPPTSNNSTTTTTSPNTPAPLVVPPGVTVTQQKTRAASTTGVGGEAKKQVRNNAQPPVNNGNSAPSSGGAASSSNAAKGDGPSWNDENCKLRLVINRFSLLEETTCSPPKSIEGVSWKIMVMPKQHMVQKKQQKCMGFFLQCAPERAYSDQWSVHAVADMRMISYKPNVPHFARRTTHTYTSKENDWGYSCFMTWADIIDEAQGYIRDDTVVLEIAVKAEAPKNMMTHEDFLDKIEKWIVLADMQMKKGNIDLALEANQSAMKFCKGKDDECYQKLETQRETFVNAKLFESIERIEKGPVVCTDTTHGKPTSLRQALTGAQKSLNGKITAKGGKKTRAVVTVQHMKKKKPYDQNNTTQQRNATGGPTVKDLVEKRKSSKDDATKNLLKSKEELDAEHEDLTDSEEDEKATAGSEDEDDQDFEDEEYNEGDYQDQADECSTLGGEFGSSVSGNANRNDQDVGEDGDVDDVWDDEDELRGCDAELFKAAQSSSDEDVQMCDRMVQVDYVDLLEGLPLEESALFDDRLLAETVLTRFAGPDADKSRIDLEAFHGRMGFQATPGDSIESIFGVESIEKEDAFSREILDSLPQRMPLRATKDGSFTSITMAEKMIKSWMDVEGSLTGNLDPDGVLARLSPKDRQDLIDELSFKINPLIVTLDLEFRDTVHLARNFHKTTRNALDESNKMAAECEDIKKVFEERLSVKANQDQQQKRPVEITTTTKKTTSAAATSGAGAKAVTHGRPTVIAKRSMKQVLPVDSSAVIGGDNRDHAFEQFEIPEDGQNMRDVHMAFRNLNSTMQPMIAQIGANNRKVQKMFAELLGENGTLPSYMKDLSATHNQQSAKFAKDLSIGREALHNMTEEKVKLDKLLIEKEKALAAEVERHSKTQKETKDLKNQLKKAESKSTKEENRATGLQVQLNDLDEKSKMLRKELETLKKKSAEERTKTKKEKERDTQTIRQQTIEISERENERDKARKEVDEANRGRDKVEKEKKAVAAQLAAMTERARAGEVAVMESRCSAALEEMKKRKEAVQNGYTETESLASRVRQVSDRDMMRKSLAEWKAALDKCDAQTKAVNADYEHAIEQIKSGVKTLVQTFEIKLPAVDPLPKLVKPPPVQVVAPSSPAIPAPIMPPTPAAGVIGQQRATPIGRDPASPCATPTRSSRLPRVPSPVKSVTPRTDDAPTSLWSWNTIGNLGDLRPANDSFNNSSMDSLQRDIWAANGNGNGSLGNDFMRGSNASAMSNSMSNNASMTSSQAPSPFLRQSSQSTQQAQYASQQSQMQQQQAQNSRMQQQQQQARGYGDMWNNSAIQSQNSAQQEYGNPRMMAHNGSGDLTNGGGYSPWHNPAGQQQPQLRGGGQQQQGHHNMFQQSHFYDSGM